MLPYNLAMKIGFPNQTGVRPTFFSRYITFSNSPNTITKYAMVTYNHDSSTCIWGYGQRDLVMTQGIVTVVIPEAVTLKSGSPSWEVIYLLTKDLKVLGKELRQVKISTP